MHKHQESSLNGLSFEARFKAMKYLCYYIVDLHEIPNYFQQFLSVPTH